jgi:hypothetical protein
MKLWVLQYKSVDGNWYDSGAFSELDLAKDVWDKTSRPHNYRVVERSDKVVWPLDEKIDPAKELGA